MIQKIKITQEALKKKLEKGECKFSFNKLDGTTREARGTTKIESIPEDIRPKGGTSVAGVAYYDLDVKGWRSIAESQEIFMGSEDLMESYDTPNLTEEEINLMIWVHGKLEDQWLEGFIGLIVWASKDRVADLYNCGRLSKMVRTVRTYSEDITYAAELRSKWNKLISE